MPLYMDVHSLDGAVTFEDVGKAHQADLQTQGGYDVSYLRYWVDGKHGKIFCLVEAPTADAAATVHREAHGLVAEEIYEVQEGSQKAPHVGCGGYRRCRDHGSNGYRIRLRAAPARSVDDRPGSLCHGQVPTSPSPRRPAIRSWPMLPELPASPSRRWVRWECTTSKAIWSRTRQSMRRIPKPWSMRLTGMAGYIWPRWSMW